MKPDDPLPKAMPGEPPGAYQERIFEWALRNPGEQNWQDARQAVENYKRVYKAKIQPRKFTEIADHFTRVTKSIEWPEDESDIE